MSDLAALFARVDAMDVPHAPGAECPVTTLLGEYFGEELGGALLWDYTAFPFSDEHALAQAKQLVAADLDGRLPHFLREADAEVVRRMREAATR